MHCPPPRNRPRSRLFARLVGGVLGWSAGLIGAGALPADAQAAHALAWGAEPKYPPDFRHFDYVNPDAPRGGSVNRDGFGSFDKLNPFTLRGIAAAGINELMFETLGESATASAIEQAVIAALGSGKIKSLAAGKMGLSTMEVGDLVASCIK